MLVLEGTAYLKGKLERCAIGIEEGRIVAIKKTLRGDEHRDFGDMLLLPGGIDIHVHLREPGMTQKEDFESGTTSAAAGGITTVFDMPNTLPPTTTLVRYEDKLKTVSKKSLVDFGLYGGMLTGRETARLAGVAQALKLYLAPTTGGIEVKPQEVSGLVRALPSESPPVVVHAEDPEKFAAKRPANLVEHNFQRPADSEASAVRFLRTLGKAFHVTHVTSSAGLETLHGSGFTADATPHHLLLDCASPLRQLGKVNPPLREPAERDALWRAFAEGRVEMLASDHAPHAPEEKDTAFAEAPAGMPGVETMIPLLLRKVRSAELTLERLVNAVCERPAGLMRLRKGAIDVGMDADIAVVDLRAVSTIRGKVLHSKCGWTAFEGWEAVFPKATYLRGKLIVDAGEVVEDCAGRLVKQAKMTAASGASGEG